MIPGARTVIRTAAALCAAFPLCVAAQGFPAKPVRLVVPFPAGGTADLIGRMIAAKASEQMGQPVIVDNRVGASGVIGSEFVARSAPDGYTLLMTTTSTHLLTFLVLKSLPYDPIKDFTPITAAAESFTGIVVTPSLGVTTLGELLDIAKRSPGKLTYSSAGVGSAFHLTGELFKQAAEVDIVHVPYKGAGQALNDLMSGTIAMTFSALTSQLPYIRSGKVRLLAVLGAKRFTALPDVPAMNEILPKFERPDSWMGFFGPAGLPPSVLRRLNAEIVGAVTAPQIRAKLEAEGNSPIGNTPEQFAVLLKSGLEIYARAVKTAGLKVE